MKVRSDEDYAAERPVWCRLLAACQSDLIADEREQHDLCDCTVECIAKRSIINGAIPWVEKP